MIIKEIRPPEVWGGGGVGGVAERGACVLPAGWGRTQVLGWESCPGSEGWTEVAPEQFHAGERREGILLPCLQRERPSKGRRGEGGRGTSESDSSQAGEMLLLLPPPPPAMRQRRVTDSAAFAASGNGGKRNGKGI